MIAAIIVEEYLAQHPEDGAALTRRLSSSRPHTDPTAYTRRPGARSETAS